MTNGGLCMSLRTSGARETNFVFATPQNAGEANSNDYK
ncbi:hypothetical protein MROS_0522 [Melioribacter roseus P3M-2]|uniref:Uncharacterized protein n=1 Tax=Melioribacter roseus (strain DSM 23840 / JCM 17771 / VKM B-2668 / P3M-2) TaxID=1191523 RepID=I6Z3P1_MELRP|nr:hypothetical protein MROS_0522 [Melioribacter roseus P3M-2]